MLQNKKIIFNSDKFKIDGEIFFPSDINDKTPAIIFCQGIYSWYEIYRWVVRGLAEKNYIVISFDYPGQGRSQGFFQSNINLQFIESPLQYSAKNWRKTTINAINYLINDSPISDFVDNKSIGILGHSLGGRTASEVVAVDNRIKAAVFLTHTNLSSIKNIDIPVQLQGGDNDLALFSIPTLLRSYKKLDSPKQLIMIKKATHEGFTSVRNRFDPIFPEYQKDVSLSYMIPWFDYFLKNKKDRINDIIRADDKLSDHIISKYNFNGKNVEMIKK